jgi:hypothetical protein
MEYSMGTDRNGNRVLRVKPRHGRGFSIQTLGNLPATHAEGVTCDTGGEVAWWVAKFGTERQKRIMEGGAR